MPSAGFERAIPATEHLAPDRSGHCDTVTVRHGRADEQTAGVQALKVVQLPAVGTATGTTAIPTQT